VIHSLQRGGAERLLVDLAEVAPSAGLELSVLSLMPVASDGYAADLRQRDVQVESLDLASRWSVAGPVRATAALRSLAPQIVHAHMKHADVAAAYASMRLRVPFVSTLHVIEDAVGPLGRAKRWFAAQARLRRAARTITVSDAQRRWYLETFVGADAERVVTVRNGVVPPAPASSDAREHVRAELGATAADVLAVNVSIMREGKGHEVLIDALARIPAELALRVALVGDGPLRPSLEALVARSPARDRIVFAGFREDVDAVLDACDVVVHPTFAEALPTALIQALAAGRPVIASDVGGVGEIVTAGEGVLLPPGDVGALADALASAAADGTWRANLGATARRRFERDFDATAWARRLRAVYDEVLSERGN
jgi:glycosyltransferase involved in cell wall biosynthesis